MQRADRTRLFLVIAALVVSHFVLDGLVHVAGLPMAGKNSPQFGLGRWKNMPAELLETVMAPAVVVIYWQVAGNSAASRWGVATFMVLLTALTWTQLFVLTPPVPAQLDPELDCRAAAVGRDSLCVRPKTRGRRKRIRLNPAAGHPSF